MKRLNRKQIQRIIQEVEMTISDADKAAAEDALKKGVVNKEELAKIINDVEPDDAEISADQAVSQIKKNNEKVKTDPQGNVVNVDTLSESQFREYFRSKLKVLLGM